MHYVDLKQGSGGVVILVPNAWQWVQIQTGRNTLVCACTELVSFSQVPAVNQTACQSGVGYSQASDALLAEKPMMAAGRSTGLCEDMQNHDTAEEIAADSKLYKVTSCIVDTRHVQ